MPHPEELPAWAWLIGLAITTFGGWLAARDRWQTKRNREMERIASNPDMPAEPQPLPPTTSTEQLLFGQLDRANERIEQLTEQNAKLHREIALKEGLAGENIALQQQVLHLKRTLAKHGIHDSGRPVRDKPTPTKGTPKVREGS